MAAKSNKPKTSQSSDADAGENQQSGGRLAALGESLFNERNQRIAGLFLILFSVFLCFAFVSHLFNWRSDFATVSQHSWFELISDRVNEVNNSMGEFGALFAYVFFHQWFGVASFLIPFFFFLLGFKWFFSVSLLPLRKTFLYSLFTLIFVSVSTTLFTDNDLVYGGFGFHLYTYLKSIAGVGGVVLILSFSLILFLMLGFDFQFRLPERKPRATETSPGAAAVVAGNQPLHQASAASAVAGDDDEELDDEPLEEDEAIDPSAFEFTVRTEKDTRSASLAGQGSAPTLEINMPELLDEPEIPLEASNPLTFVDSTENGVEGLTEEEKARMNLTEVLAENQEFDLGEYDPTLDLSSYVFPESELLENHGSNKAKVDKAELEANSNRIIDTLKSYGIEIAKISASIGPTVTLYEIIPAAGVRISKIKNLEDDIALSLSALGIRIIAPMPGKGTIGIEVPNQHPEVVAMKTLITSEKFANTSMDLPVALGKTISNENFVADLAKMPHLLMAGATGQGKSVGLNAILVSLLYKKHPSQIKFVLVDPKKVELTLFNKIERHFLAKLPNNEEAIITDVKKVVYTLNSLCVLMDQRYELLKMAMVRNIKEYNAKFLSRKLNPKLGHHYMPYIVLVVDEFADLIMTAGKEVELPIARLAQLARAIGIHLIIATQRPSVNIITGTIKANFPARVAFRVTSKIDSRTILDSGGADQLIGRGDLLFSTGSDLIRLQCPFVDTPEVERICEFIGNQRGYPSAFILPEYIDENADIEEDFDIGERDSMFDEAAHIVVTHQQGSASLLQRKLKLGYNRAGRIIDQLEKAGVIGPFEGSKARKVLIKDSVSLEQFLKGSDSEL